MNRNSLCTKAMRLLGVAGFIVGRRNFTTSAQLAEEFGRSRRVIQRDVNDLRSMGLDIQGEPGCGFSISRKAFNEWLGDMFASNPTAKRAVPKPNLYERRMAIEERAAP